MYSKINEAMLYIILENSSFGAIRHRFMTSGGTIISGSYNLAHTYQNLIKIILSKASFKLHLNVA